jgi:hypothetical protein
MLVDAPGKEVQFGALHAIAVSARSRSPVIGPVPRRKIALCGPSDFGDAYNRERRAPPAGREPQR